MDLVSIGVIVSLIFGIIISGFLFIFVISIIFEIPEFIRSRRISNLASKYNLTFKRIKEENKNWSNGFGFFSNNENNFLYGSIKNVTIEFNDCLLVEGTLNNYSAYGTGLHSTPSIAEISNKWNLSGTGSGATTQRASKLNGFYYSRLKLKDLIKLFEKINKGETISASEIKEFFKRNNFYNHIIKNTKVAGFISSLLFIFIFFIAILVYNNTSILDSKNSLTWVFIGDFMINIVVYVWAARKYGRRFSPEPINEIPNSNPRS